MNAMNTLTSSLAAQKAPVFTKSLLTERQGVYLRLAATLCVAAVLLLVCSTSALAAATAVDNADDAAYGGDWIDGDNGGFGFGPWILLSQDENPATGDFFIGNSTENGSAPPSGGINTTGVAFGLFAHSGDAIQASREFTGGPLSVGQSFILDMDNGDVQTGSYVGFGLNSAFDNRFSFGYEGGDTNYTLYDDNGILDTGVPVTDDGLTVAVTLTGTNTYRMTITAPRFTESVELVGTLFGSGDIQAFNLTNINAGSLINAYAYFNFVEVADAPTLPGDFDGNDLVAQGDLDLVLLNWAELVPPTPVGWVEQIPTDGQVDQNELDGVLLNWANTPLATATSAVPEPSSFTLVLAALCLAVGRRRKQV
jgi:hypothetical protein